MTTVTLHYNYIHENRPFPLNDIARSVFVNHFYAQESLVLVTSKRFIRLAECDASTEHSMRNSQQQGINHETVDFTRMARSTDTNKQEFQNDSTIKK